MATKTSQQIIDYIREKGQVSPKELTGFLDIQKRAVFKQLKKLYDEGIIDKIGKPPRVFYLLKSKIPPEQHLILKPEIKKAVEQNYLIITPKGEKLSGLEGFIYWCQKNNLPVEKTGREYKKTLDKYNHYKKGDFIDGTYKLKSTFNQVFVDQLFYLDFYSIERFGKTKLGWSLLYAKQSQDKSLIKELNKIIKKPVDKLVKRYKINAVGYIPPTVKRETQFMLEMAKNLCLNLPVISIKKIKTPVVVPQKTLNKLDDRIINARNTFVVDEEREFANVLLIDDAVGSGATINEIASKIKSRRVAQGKVYGLAITGSFKGFEVISEV